MLDKSDGCTKPAFVNLFLRLVDFFVRMWLLKACFLLIFPLPVTVNLFLALDFVFIFGIFYFVFEVNTISKLLFLFRVDHDGHALTF